MISPAREGAATPRRRIPDLRDETGTTLMELLVSLTAGLMVFGSIAALMTMTIRQSGRVTGHVEANQRARVAMTKIVGGLNSACYFPQVKPVRAGSRGSKLVFWHQTGRAVSPKPIQSTVELVNGELIQKNNTQPVAVGTEYKFVGEGAAESLMKGVAPLEGASSIFTYYTYANGKISPTPLAPGAEGLTAAQAALVVLVKVAFRVSPEPPISEDDNSDTGIQNSVLLRLTPPSYSNTSSNPPCE